MHLHMHLSCAIDKFWHLSGEAPACNRRKQARAALGLHEGSSCCSSFCSLPFGLLSFLLSHLQLQAQQLKFLTGLSQLCLCLIYL